MTTTEQAPKPATPPTGGSGASDPTPGVRLDVPDHHVTHQADAPTIRWCALQAAVSVRHPNDEPSDVVADALVFERYLFGEVTE